MGYFYTGYRYTATGHGFRHQLIFPAFISATVWCTTVIYYMVITAIFRLQESFLIVTKAQELGVQEGCMSWKPGLGMSPVRV